MFVTHITNLYALAYMREDASSVARINIFNMTHGENLEVRNAAKIRIPYDTQMPDGLQHQRVLYMYLKEMGLLKYIDKMLCETPRQKVQTWYVPSESHLPDLQVWASEAHMQVGTFDYESNTWSDEAPKRGPGRPRKDESLGAFGSSQEDEGANRLHVIPSWVFSIKGHVRQPITAFVEEFKLIDDRRSSLAPFQRMRKKKPMQPVLLEGDAANVWNAEEPCPPEVAVRYRYVRGVPLLQTEGQAALRGVKAEQGRVAMAAQDAQFITHPETNKLCALGTPEAQDAIAAKKRHGIGHFNNKQTTEWFLAQADIRAREAAFDHAAFEAIFGKPGASRVTTPSSPPVPPAPVVDTTPNPMIPPPPVKRGNLNLDLSGVTAMVDLDELDFVVPQQTRRNFDDVPEDPRYAEQEEQFLQSFGATLVEPEPAPDPRPWSAAAMGFSKPPM